ncbi:OLC1v1029600C1 [Oldenlandia corymbosa var. corymbosa]|uniref:CASP-like protein n=1 Tax=Oldenlandia corymbosa var. corymbosa TaxID=529605 RepID=A0AAV1CG95_OLDCO|nr:OLC1v1029600C1 [Oldenlandia corymbosa var. corymbosa]
MMSRDMAFVSPVSSRSPLHPPLPTPSPFTTYSVASTGWSARPPPIHVYNIVLRSLALLLSFVSALSLSIPSSKSPSFHDYQTLTYCFIVNTSAFVYSAYQLFKSIWDIAYPGICISEKTSDYINFVFDQVMFVRSRGEIRCLVSP